MASTAATHASDDTSSRDRFVGVTVLPEYVQSEGIEGVLRNLVERVGANAVALSPYVMEEADQQSGKREPPLDAGAGGVRLLDRPLFGKREVWVRTAPSFEPERRLYQALRYQPPSTTELTKRQGHIVGDFVREAKSAGLKVYLQIQAAIPPGYRVQFGGPVKDDRPRLPDGSIPSQRLAKNGSIASEHILCYQDALIRDLCNHYPDLNGLRFDWPEYPPYFLDSVFLDFGDHARQAAAQLGFEFDSMQREVGQLYDKLHGGLQNADLERILEQDGGRFHLLRAIVSNPGVADWLRFKADLVQEMLQRFRRTMNEAAGESMEMMPNAFPPPWSLVSGMDFARVAKSSSAISCKLYTMHWPMILRFYGDQIVRSNPDLSSKLVTRVLVRALDIADNQGLDRLEDYRYPGPNQPHPVGSHAQRRKIVQAQHEAGATPIYALAHGYGPLDDFRQRLEIAWKASRSGIWVNRYAYLTDEKLDAIGQVVRSAN